MMLSLALFASGNGSNLIAIFNAIQNKQLDSRINLVLSNNSESGALQFAREHGLNAIHLSSKTAPNHHDFITTMLQNLTDAHINFIALAGYMKIVPAEVITYYKNKIVNIHPALLPRFGGPGMYGLHVHEAVLKSGEKKTGATVHFVDEIYDHGAIILQKEVDVLETDTPQTLAERVLKVEHEIYPRTLQLFAEHRVQVDHNRVTILSAPNFTHVKN